MRVRLAVVTTAVAALAGAAAALTPPMESWAEAGFDSKGVFWIAHARVGAPLVVHGGGRSFTVAGSEGLDHLSLRAVVDERDRLWAIDARGDAVEVGLADGKGRRVQILKGTYVTVDPVAHAGALWFGERGDREWLTRYDVQAGTSRRVHATPGRLEGFALAGDLVWVFDCPRDPQPACEIQGVEPASGRVAVRDRRALPPIDQPGGQALAAGSDGSVWLASGGSASVHQRTREGAWRQWEFRKPRALVPGAVVVVDGTAVFTLTEYASDPDAHLRPPFMSGVRSVACELAAIDGATRALHRLPIDCGPRGLRRDQKGGLWLDLGNQAPTTRVVVGPAGLELVR